VHEYNLTHDVYKKWDLSGWGLPRPNLDASYLSLNKYDKAQPQFNREAMDGAKKFMYNMFGPYVSNWIPISRELAINELESSSSPGEPWSKVYPTNALLLANGLDKLNAAVDNIEHEPIIWKNSLKEEIRPMEKILLNKIRTFTASPAHFTVYASQYCWDFNNKFYDSHGKTWSAVGLDPYYRGWHYVYTKLKRFQNAFELDLSEYDSSIFRHLLFSIAEFRLDTVHPDHYHEVLRPLQFIYNNIVNSCILTADGNIVMKTTGNPSGQTNTIVDNTLALFMILSYVWILKTGRSYEDFVSLVTAWLCGDDNTMTVSDEVVDVFNARVIRDVCAEIGMTVTSPIYDPQPVEHVTFLSRKFDHFYRGYCIPYMPPEKMLTSIMFSEDPNDPARLLQRVGGFINVAWPDPEFTGYLRNLVSFIIDKYGVMLESDVEWHKGLTSILTPGEVQHLFVGVRRVQRFGGSAVKILCPPKVVLLVKKQVMEKQAKKGKITVRVKPDGQIVSAKKQGSGGGVRSNKRQRKTQNKKEQVVLRVQPTMGERRRGANREHMQKLAPKGFTKAARALLEAISLPQNSPPFRLYSGYNDVPTGAACPFEQEPIVYGTEVETFAFAFRSALRNAVRGIPLTVEDYTMYWGRDRVKTDRGAGWTNVCPRALFHADPNINSFTPTTPGAPTSASPHGDYLFAGRLKESDQFRGFWVNTGDGLAVYATTPIADTLSVRLMRLEGQEWTQVGKPINMDATTAVAVFPPYAPVSLSGLGDYLAIQVQNITPGAATGADTVVQMGIYGGVGTFVLNPPAAPTSTVNVACDSDFCCGHRTIKDLTNRFKIVDNIKVFGCSILYTNTSAFTSNQGQVAMAQIPGTNAWTDNYQYQTIASMNSLKCKYQPVTNGSYCFLKPGEVGEFNYLSEFVVSSDNSSSRISNASGPDGFEDGAFEIYTRSDYLATVVSQDPVTQRSGIITIANTLQFSTNDNWTEVKLPTYDSAMIEPAMRSLRGISQFHENEFHISDVFNWLKDAAATVVNGVLEYGPIALKGAAMVAPFLL
jgi:hypothetical protein